MHGLRAGALSCPPRLQTSHCCHRDVEWCSTYTSALAAGILGAARRAQRARRARRGLQRGAELALPRRAPAACKRDRAGPVAPLPGNRRAPGAVRLILTFGPYALNPVSAPHPMPCVYLFWPSQAAGVAAGLLLAQCRLPVEALQVIHAATSL